MVYNKIGSYALNKANPFLEETVQHIEKGEKSLFFANKEPDIIIDSVGAVQGHSLFVRRQKVDKAKFMKVFMSGLSNWFDLSKAGIKVFAYVAHQIEPNRDTFIFNLEKCKTFTGYKSNKMIFSGLAELAGNKFIARGENPFIYYINPTVFFNGDRLTFIEHYEVEKTAGRVEDKQLNFLELFDGKPEHLE